MLVGVGRVDGLEKNEGMQACLGRERLRGGQIPGVMGFQGCWDTADKGVVQGPGQ